MGIGMGMGMETDRDGDGDGVRRACDGEQSEAEGRPFQFLSIFTVNDLERIVLHFWIIPAVYTVGHSIQ